MSMKKYRFGVQPNFANPPLIVYYKYVRILRLALGWRILLVFCIGSGWLVYASHTVAAPATPAIYYSIPPCDCE